MTKEAQNNLRQKKQYDSSAEVAAGADLVTHDVRAQYFGEQLD